MSDTYEHYKDRVEDYQQRLGYVEPAAGFAVAVSGNFVSVDLFDKPSTCRKVWSRLLSGLAMDALEAPQGQRQADAGRLERMLHYLTKAEWEPVVPAVEGNELRRSGKRTEGSALFLKRTLIHSSVVTSV